MESVYRITQKKVKCIVITFFSIRLDVLIVRCTLQNNKIK